MPLSISIVTPSLNQAGFIEETIRSVLDQGYPKLEYVIVDGGSRDGSTEIIDKYRAQLHYAVSEADTGQASALNKGFARTTGDIMAWLNSDDKYLPWTLKTVSEIFERFPEVNWITGLNSWWNDRGAMIATRYTYNNVFDYLSGKFFGIQQESCFWRRSLWQKAGGHVDESYRFMLDAELWTRFFRTDELWHAGCVLAGYRLHQSNRASRFQEQCRQERDRAIGTLRASYSPDRLRGRERDYLVLAYDTPLADWTKIRVARTPDSA